MKHLFLFGAPNSGELVILFIVLVGLLYFIFKAGTWYGKSKKD